MLVGCCQASTWAWRVLRSGSWPLAFGSWLSLYQSALSRAPVAPHQEESNLWSSTNSSGLEAKRDFEVKRRGRLAHRAARIRSKAERSGHRPTQAVWSEAT